MPGTVTVRNDRGDALDVPEEQLDAYVARGFKPEGVNEQASRLAAEHQTEEYGTPVGTFASFGTGALGTITGGLSDAAIAAAGGASTLRAIKEESPTAGTVGGIAGAFVPIGAVGAATKVGRGVAEGIGGGLLGKALGGASEGAIYGLGSGVSELTLDKDPLTLERASSVLSSNVLYGAGIGSAAGTLGYGIERGLQKAKGALDSVIERNAAKTQVVTDGAVDIPTADQIRAAGEEINSTIPASAIRDYGWYEPKGYGDDVVKAEKGHAAIREGQRDPIQLVVDDQGRILVDDGRNRLNAAIAQGAPIRVQWTRGRGTGPDDVFKGRGLGRQPAVDLSRLDARGLKAARETEEGAIEAALAPHRAQLVDDLKTYRNAYKEHDLRGATFGTADREVREAGGAFSRNELALRKLLDDRVGLAKSPEKVMGVLRAQEQGLATIERESNRLHAAWSSDVETAPQRFRDLIQRGEVSGRTGPFTPEGLEFQVNKMLKDESGLRWGTQGASRFGLQAPPIVAEREAIAATLRQNRALQARLQRLPAASTSGRLTQIDAALERLASPREPSLGERVLGALPVVGGPLGAVAAGANKTLGGFRAVVGKAAERTGKAVSSFLGKAERGAAAATPYAPVLATKVLSSVRYAPPGAVRRQSPGAQDDTEGATSLAKLYKARTDEIKTQTAYDVTGVPKLRPAARQAMAARFDGIRPSDPILADRLESAGARRIEYLSSLIPRRPDFGVGRVGPDHWQPSDMEMRSWARSAAAVEDPHGVLERAVHGAVTPEDIGALQAVYPGLLADFTAQVAARLPELRRSLPIARQTALSIMTGVPVNPAMDPAILSVLQAQYQFEPQAPRAQPQFGSVRGDKSEPGTPAQQREQGTA